MIIAYILLAIFQYKFIRIYSARADFHNLFIGLHLHTLWSELSLMIQRYALIKTLIRK